MVSVIENRKRNVLIWLDALNPDTKHLTGVGLKYGISKSRVAQVRDKVWRWIRHPGYCFTPEIRQLTHTRPKRLPGKIRTDIADILLRDIEGGIVPTIYLGKLTRLDIPN